MENFLKPLAGMINLLLNVISYWLSDGKQSKLIKTKINAFRYGSMEQRLFRSALPGSDHAGMKAESWR